MAVERLAVDRGVKELVIAELCARIDALDRRLALMRTAQLANDLDSIRRLAAASGFGAVSPVVHALEAALACGEHGPALTNGLALLRDAVRSADDTRGRAVFAAAACSLRIAR